MERTERYIEIDAPVSRVFDFFSDFESLPRWMENIRSVECRGRRYMHWVVDAPLGAEVEWDAAVTAFEQDRRIAWRSVRGDVDTEGEVTFESTRRGTTLMHVNMAYDPPAGRLGAVVSRLFGNNPERQLTEDLARFKRLVEGRRDDRQYDEDRDYDERERYDERRRYDEQLHYNERANYDEGRRFDERERRSWSEARPSSARTERRQGYIVGDNDRPIDPIVGDYVDDGRRLDERRSGDDRDNDYRAGDQWQEQEGWDRPHDRQALERGDRRYAQNVDDRATRSGSRDRAYDDEVDVRNDRARSARPARDRDVPERVDRDSSSSILRRGVDRLLDSPPSGTWRKYK